MTGDCIASIVYSFRPYASKLVYGSDYTADDLLQDVSLNLLKSKNLPNDEVELQKITCTAIRNSFINFLRWQKRRQGTVSFSTEHEQFNYCEDCFQYTEKLRNVIDSIRKMGSAHQREALDLFIQGYSYKEIASRTNVPIGTVKGRIHIIRTMVKEQWS